MTDKKTAKKKIKDALYLAALSGNPWRIIREISLIGVSECSASARLREMARTGEVEGRFREGKKEKEWRLLTT